MSRTPTSRAYAFDLAAAGLLAGALVHLAAWSAGPSWMEALGAPPSIVSSAATGSWPAAIGTLAIAATLVGLAWCCVVAAGRAAGSILLRRVLMLVAAIFVARGLLIVPFLLAGQRQWRTSFGTIIVTGEWFAAGSMVVLVIGLLIGLGLYQTRPGR